MDPQRNLDIICGAPIPRGSEQPSMYDVLKGDKHLEDIFVQTDVGTLAPASNLMYQWTGTPLLSLEEYRNLCSDPDALMGQLRARYAQVTDPMQDDTHRLERELKRMAEQDRFDYVIVDSNPDLGYLTTLSLLCWPELKVVIPAFAEESSREAILELYDTIRVLERQDFNRRIEILGFLLTRYENVRPLPRSRRARPFSSCTTLSAFWNGRTSTVALRFWASCSPGTRMYASTGTTRNSCSAWPRR